MTNTLSPQLRTRLAERAADAGLLDVAYRVIDSPLGPLLLAATEHGLVRVAFEREGHDTVLQAIAAQVSPRVLELPARLDPAARELDEYFARHRQQFDLQLDLQLVRGSFRRQVVEQLPGISFGRTASYRDLAAALGNPGATRAVGTACATNPLPLVVPCHRVVRTDGQIGNYLGGTDAKRYLLNFESAA